MDAFQNLLQTCPETSLSAFLQQVSLATVSPCCGGMHIYRLITKAEREPHIVLESDCEFRE
jgi:hypothetical protein